MSILDSYCEITDYVQTACFELAYDSSAESNYPSLFNKARRTGVRDIKGWLADELYNDRTTVRDLVGDRLYDLLRSLGEDPLDKETWERHMTALSKYIPALIK
jgi:hypothetical protein